VVVKSESEGTSFVETQDSSNSSVEATVSSSTPGLGVFERESTASPSLAKKDEKDGAKSRGSSREKDNGADGTRWHPGSGG
jgi:hypothetical protein